MVSEGSLLGGIQSIGCGELPVPVCLGARGAVVKFAGFARHRTASGASNGQDLFGGHVIRSHVPHYVMHRCGKQFHFAL